MADADHTHPPSHGALGQARGVEKGRWVDEKDKRDGWMGGKNEGAPSVLPNSCNINKTHSQAETK